MADSRFEKKFRLLSASDFSALKVGSLSYKKPSFIIYYKKNPFNLTRIGLSVSKKIGKAPFRNRFKRLLRETFRLSDFKFLGFDILIVVSWSRVISNEPQEYKEQLLIKNTLEFFQFLEKNQRSST